MAEMWFSVKGSTGSDYRIKVLQTPTGFRIDCTCPAGGNLLSCKHRFALLAGDGKAVVSSSHPVADVVALVQGSRLEAAIIHMNALEAEAERVKRALTAAKKQVARAMAGN